MLVRPDIRLNVPGQETALPIPEAMPPEFVSTQVHMVEDIGEPVSACFLTPSLLENGTKWYLHQLDYTYSFLLSLAGGCLRSMMVLEDSGIR